MKTIHNRASFETEMGPSTDKNIHVLQTHTDMQS